MHRMLTTAAALALLSIAPSAHDQDDVAPRQADRLAHEGHADHLAGEVLDPVDAPEERDAHDHRRDQADPAGEALLLRREARRQHRDEHHVVDAEHDLERGQREQCEQVFRSEDAEDRFHGGKRSGGSKKRQRAPERPLPCVRVAGDRPINPSC